METESYHQPKERKGVTSALNAAIEALNLAKEVASITPAKAVFGSVSVTLVMIRDAMANQMDYVELGLDCANVCATLHRGLSGKRLDDLNSSVREAINQLTRAVEEIERKVMKEGKRNVVVRHLHAKYNKEKITAWRLDLVKILNIFNIELAVNTHVIVSDTHAVVSGLEQNVTSTHLMVSAIHRGMANSEGGSEGKNVLTQSRLGESPPPAPRACFGRDELIDKIVGLAENLTPVALIGAGGIGKTSIALTALHHDRIKRRFGDNRRFIRCDQLTPSCAQFLNRLSEAVGAGVENPKGLANLRPSLSSKEIFVVLDNAESILDPQGMDSREIYSVVEELSRFDNICLCITSRISTIPSDCQTLGVPTLSIEAAREAFYRIYKNGEQSNLVNSILDQLDFHPLSITLLATVAHHNKWDTDRLAQEWETRKTTVLRTEHNDSLAATIELSLASPLFQELGPDARALLGIVAFFPQGVNENNLDWLFPTVPNRANIFDKLCILSLTYRSSGFIRMLAPLRDYLSPKDPTSSSLLCTTKDRYFIRMSVDIDPNKANFEESQWITSEDVNVEHLLDVFTTIDANSDDAWGACAGFMQHLFWHKNRLVVLKQKVETLPDDSRFKPECLFWLSKLLCFVGNWEESKRLFTRALELQKERGSDYWVARILVELCQANRLVGLRYEGIQRAKEALGICERLGDTVEQARCLEFLADSLHADGQFDAAEEAASCAIDLLREEGNQFLVCNSHHILAEIYQSKGMIENAIHHFEATLEIASPFNWHNELFWAHCKLAELFRSQGRFDDAQAHVERAKSHMAGGTYYLGRAMEEQSMVWYGQHRFEEARSEALRAIDIFEKLGARQDLERCRGSLLDIEEKLNNPVAHRQPGSNSQGTKRRRWWQH